MSAEAGWELLLLKPVWTSRHARPLIENSVIHPNKRVSLRPAEGGLPSACRAVWPENTSKLLAGGRRKTPQRRPTFLVRALHDDAGPPFRFCRRSRPGCRCGGALVSCCLCRLGLQISVTRVAIGLLCTTGTADRYLAATSFASAQDVPTRADRAHEAMPIQSAADRPDYSKEQPFISENEMAMNKMMEETCKTSQRSRLIPHMHQRFAFGPLNPARIAVI